MFLASIVKTKTINKDVLDSEWALTSDKLCTQVGLHLSTDKNVCKYSNAVHLCPLQKCC